MLPATCTDSRLHRRWTRAAERYCGRLATERISLAKRGCLPAIPVPLPIMKHDWPASFQSRHIARNLYAPEWIHGTARGRQRCFAAALSTHTSSFWRCAMQSRQSAHSLLIAALLLTFAACAEEPTAPTEVVAPDDGALAGSADSRTKKKRVECDADNAGITVPRGFCALVVADLRDDEGRPLRARHMAVTPSGD